MIVKQRPTLSSQSPESSELNLKVLLVEKNWSDQRLVSKMLETRGCTVTPAGNLQEAGNLIKNIDLDMVLMDATIFRNNGFDIKAALQQSEIKRGKRIPMIALAGNHVKEQRDYFMGIGMDEYIPKPVFEEELCRIVERLVENTFFLSDESDDCFQRQVEKSTV